MKRFFAITLCVCLFLTACGKAPDETTAPTTSEPTTEATTQTTTEATTETTTVATTEDTISTLSTVSLWKSLGTAMLPLWF